MRFSIILRALIMLLLFSIPGKATAYSISVTEGPALPQGRGAHAAGVLGDKMVVLGGTNWNEKRTEKHWLSDCTIYLDGIWQQSLSFPIKNGESMYCHDGQAIYIAGGRNDAEVFRDAYRLCLIAGKLLVDKLPPLPIAIHGGAGVELNGKFYVSCGFNKEGRQTSDLWSLDIAKPNAGWLRCRPLPGCPRAYPALAASGQYLYLLGGYARLQENTMCLQDAYRYDSQSNEWKCLPNLPWPGYAWSAAAIDDNYILLAGGAAYGNISKDIWLVNTQDMSTQKLGEAIIQTCTASLVKVDNKTWWLLGGEPDVNKSRTNKVTVIKLND